MRFVQITEAGAGGPLRVLFHSRGRGGTAWARPRAVPAASFDPLPGESRIRSPARAGAGQQGIVAGVARDQMDVQVRDGLAPSLAFVDAGVEAVRTVLRFELGLGFVQDVEEGEGQGVVWVMVEGAGWQKGQGAGRAREKGLPWLHANR